MGRELRVLLVEDSPDDAELLLRELRRGSIEVVAKRVDTAEGMAAALENDHWDIVISDYSLPTFSGPAALQMLLERNLDLPFIVVSGIIGEDTAVETMIAGAHDYLMKGNLTRLRPAILRELREAEGRRRRQEAEEEVQASERRLRTLLENVSLVAIGLDIEGKVDYVNPHFLRLTDYGAEEVLGKMWADHFLPARFSPQSEQSFRERLEHDFQPQYEAPIRTKSGDERLISWSTTVIRDVEGNATGVLSLGEDITERRRAEEALQHIALFDTLTGLPNRALLHDRLDQALTLGQRNNTPVALLLVELDRFKEINDTFGHQTGDLVLQEVGARLRATLREADTVARLGGDEFAILLPSTDETGARLAIGKLLGALEHPFILGGQPLQVEASIGLALYPEHGHDSDTLLRRVDVAMYTAKRSHSVHAVYSADQDQYSPDRLALMGELRQAIEQGQLVLHYQPKVNLRSNLTEGVEALVRWIHPTRGFIRPDQFIALAEHTGLIGPLSVWILNEALRQCRSWLDDEIPLTVAVNLSTRNLQDEALVDIVSTALRDNEVEPSSLDLEITESAIMQDPIRALENLTLLHDMGVRISIDDFGTGYSSLGYLKRLPVDQIKIDRSFVIDMVSNPEDAYIVRTIADLGHNLDLKVVAEGIENQLTWGLLAAMGCDFAQGYHISKPLPAEELTGWLRSTSYRVLQVVNR